MLAEQIIINAGHKTKFLKKNNLSTNTITLIISKYNMPRISWMSYTDVDKAKINDKIIIPKKQRYP